MGKAKRQSQKSWRKRGAPLEEEALRVRREADKDRRTGGSISKLSTSQLFAIDSGKQQAATVSRKQALRAGAPAKQLMVDKIIATNQFIKTVDGPPTASSKPNVLSNAALLVRDKIGKARKAASRTLTHRAARAAALAANPPPQADTLDIWGSVASGQMEQRVVTKACRRSAKRRAPEGSTENAAVKVVADGASWNPAYDAHQELLATATVHELERLRKEKVHRVEALFGTGDDFEGRVPLPKQIKPQDATEDNVDEDDEDEDDEDMSDGEAGAKAGAEKPKVTAAQRKKRERARERERAAAAAKAEKAREKQLSRVGNLLSEIKQESKELTAKQQAEAAWLAVKPKKLGPKRYEPKRPEVMLTEELPSSLRNMTTEGSLLADRFDSMQARNLIEVRDRRPLGHAPGRRKRRSVLTEGSKDIKYKSPYGIAGPTPAWL